MKTRRASPRAAPLHRALRREGEGVRDAREADAARPGAMTARVSTAATRLRTASSLFPARRPPFRILLLLLLLLARARRAVAEANHGAFVHGVASGDPTSDAIVIWTRVTPTGRNYPGGVDPPDDITFDVRWTVATAPPRGPADDAVDAASAERDDDGTWGSSETAVGVDADAAAWGFPRGSIVKTGTIAGVSNETDWTVKKDVSGLSHSTRYYYAFNIERDGFRRRSEAGTFTLPPPPGEGNQRRIKLAVFSCANWGWGRFHAYDAAARGWGESLQLDAWLHLGDYTYEYGDTHYPQADDAVRERFFALRPRGEATALRGYRERHALHRADEGLRALHAAAPVMAMWDDHDITNNAWTDGGENHQPETDGDYVARRRAAIRAFHEWLPTREPRARTGDPKDDPDANLRYNRVAHFGDVASVVMLETRLLARTDPAGNPGGNVFANASGTIARWVAKRERAPARWRGSDLERTFLSLRDDLDAHRASPDREMLGAEQIAWIEKTTKASAALGVKWQVVAQASPVMDMMSPDLAKGAAALDENARGDAPPPPRGHASWTAALRAWVDWNGDDDDDGGGRTPNAKRVGVGGRDVPVDAARGLLAMGEYRLNWNFDDWHGYVADRAKLLRAVVPHANAAVILGGDSHDSWAGVVSDDARDWERPQGSTAAPRRVGAVEFDGPSVTPPGMFEHAHAWCPRALIDAGHLSSNSHTLRHARTGQRGFMLVDATAEEFAVDFVLTPSVRDASYSPRCDASFVARKESAGGGGGGGGGDDGDGLRLDARTCPDLPDALARLSDRGGNGGDDAKAAPGAWAVTSLFVVAVAFGAAGVVAGRHAPCFERSDGGGGGGGGGRVGGGGHRRSSSAVDGYGGGGGGDRKMSARERRRYSELVDADVADSQLELGEWRDERRGGGGRHEREHSH